MRTGWRDLLGDDVVTEVVGAEAFARGGTTARHGLVSEIRTEDDGRRLAASVQGGASTPYRVTVRADARAVVGWAGDCSCPLGYDCEHVAALIVSYRHRVLDAPVLAGDGPAVPAWEGALGELVRAAEAPGGGVRTPVALQFEVADAPAERTSVGAPGARHRLVRLRPVIPGRNGWVRTGVGWKQLQYDTSQAGWDPHPVAALRALYSAHQASRNQYHSYSPVDVYLHEFGPDLWRMLAHAVEDGVQLVMTGSGRPVLLSEHPAAVVVDVRRGGEGTGLRPVLRLDDRTLTPAAFSFLGVPPHGIAVHETPGALVLARLDQPVPRALAGLVGQGGAIPIPAGDVDRFLRDFYPGLRQVVPLISADGSVELPEVDPPQLVADVAHAGDGSVRVSWSIAYGADRSFSLAGPADSLAPGSGRDRKAELGLVSGLPPSAAALGELWQHGDQLIEEVLLTGMEALDFTTGVLPDLHAAAGVQVRETGNPLEYRRSTSDPQISFTVRDGKDADWFDLTVAVTVEGQVVPFGQLFRALATGRTRLVLVTGTWFSLERPEFDQLRQLIAEARSMQDVETENVQVSRFQAGIWQDLLALGVLEDHSQRWTREVRGLLEAGEAPPPPLPAGLSAELRPYQVEGYAWLSFLWDHGLGGVLADDMGLGKTLQTLAMLCRAQEAGELDRPVLVVAPTSVVSTWAREAARFAPGLQVATVLETGRRRAESLARHVAGAHVVLTSYAVFRIDAEAFEALPWSGLVLDEAQFVKNHRARTYRVAQRLPAPVKLALTGTPLENSLMDLWSLLSIVAPGLFPDPERFSEAYRVPIERRGDAEQLAKLRRRIRPLMRRRTKEMVATELPPKQEQVLEIPLNPAHEKVYQTHLQRERIKVLGLVDDMAKNRFTIFRSLTLLRQLSLDPVLIDPAYADISSSKADAFLEHVSEVVAEGHRVLVFSQFTRFLGSIKDRLDAAGIDNVYLDGRTRDRDARIQAFRTGTAPVFLISLKAGGFGLTLTEADYVYVLDPWWNPATEAQAVDRAHRIGQDKTVMVYRLVAAGTIEEKVMALKERKADLFARVVSDDGLLAGPLTADDVRGLFS